MNIVFYDCVLFIQKAAYANNFASKLKMFLINLIIW